MWSLEGEGGMFKLHLGRPLSESFSERVLGSSCFYVRVSVAVRDYQILLALSFLSPYTRFAVAKIEDLI